MWNIFHFFFLNVPIFYKESKYNIVVSICLCHIFLFSSSFLFLLWSMKYVTLISSLLSDNSSTAESSGLGKKKSINNLQFAAEKRSLEQICFFSSKHVFMLLAMGQCWQFEVSQIVISRLDPLLLINVWHTSLYLNMFIIYYLLHTANCTVKN